MLDAYLNRLRQHESQCLVQIICTLSFTVTSVSLFTFHHSFGPMPTQSYLLTPCLSRLDISCSDVVNQLVTCSLCRGCQNCSWSECNQLALYIVHFIFVCYAFICLNFSPFFSSFHLQLLQPPRDWCQWICLRYLGCISIFASTFLFVKLCFYIDISTDVAVIVSWYFRNVWASSSCTFVFHCHIQEKVHYTYPSATHMSQSILKDSYEPKKAEIFKVQYFCLTMYIMTFFRTRAGCHVQVLCRSVWEPPGQGFESPSQEMDDKRAVKACLQDFHLATSICLEELRSSIRTYVYIAHMVGAYRPMPVMVVWTCRTPCGGDRCGPPRRAWHLLFCHCWASFAMLIV